MCTYILCTCMYISMLYLNALLLCHTLLWDISYVINHMSYYCCYSNYINFYIFNRFLRFPECIFATIYGNNSYFMLLLVWKTSVSCIVSLICICLIIIVFILVHIFTSVSILLYYALYNYCSLLFILMTLKVYIEFLL